MAQLSDMHMGYLENLLVQNPGVTLFTSVFFTDIPANSDLGNIFPATSQAYGNPSRVQVQNALQAKADKAKYLAGVQIPVKYPDPSTQSLSGSLATSGNTSQTGLPNQVPQNAITVTQASIAPSPADSGVAANGNIKEGVLKQPPAYVQRVQTVTDAENSH